MTGRLVLDVAIIGGGTAGCAAAMLILSSAFASLDGPDPFTTKLRLAERKPRIG